MNTGAASLGLGFLLVSAVVGMAFAADQTTGAEPVAQAAQTQTDQGNGTAPIPIPAVSVTAAKPRLTPSQQLQLEGTAGAGYVPSTVSQVGPLGSINLLDAPYSMNVLPQDLIQNVQAPSAQPALELDPFLQILRSESVGLEVQPQSRGFPLDISEDGFRYPFVVGHIDIEDKERLEVLNGLSGFLYGIAAPGGVLNYVLKRPTADPYQSITMGDYGGASGYVHGDFGGPMDSAGRFGYRLNIVAQDGNTAIQDQGVKRTLFSGAFDWHISEDALLQVDVSRQDYRIDAPTPQWLFAGDNFIGNAPNASKDWGEPYSFERDARNEAGAKLTWSISDNLTLRSGLKYIWDRNDFLFVANVPQMPLPFAKFLSQGGDDEVLDLAAYTYLDAKFSTGFIQHKVTAGIDAHSEDSSNPLVSLNTFFEPGNLTPQQILQIIGRTPATGGPLINNAEYQNLNRVIGDEITFDDSWSAIVGANYASIVEKNYGGPPLGSLSGSLAKSLVTPSASLLYKPLPNITTYATYMQGLENGGLVGTTAFNPNTGGFLPTTNPGAQPPTVDQEYEVGVKAKLGGMLVTLALFDLNKATEIFIPNAANTMFTASNAGREEHRGAELGLYGKATDNLTLYGGVTGFQAKITNEPDDPSLIGQMPIGVSTVIAKMYAEYAIDAIPGLIVTGGVQYYNRQAVDQPNTIYIPGYVVGNVGARYLTQLYGHDTTFRLDIANVGNTNYWATVTGPGGAEEGDPLTARFSVQVKF